jgi:predicted glycoside hydrolase/deacetylase ChbG (UPF0249 family)
MKRIILCADDYGQNPAISQAIVELLEKNRLSATSCMTTSSFWPVHAQWLEPFKEKVDIGLHFNLTEGDALSDSYTMQPLSQLLIKAHLRQLNIQALQKECHAQIDQFIDVLGRAPDFIDGHQHIHQFPLIRAALLAVYEKRLRLHGSYIRCTSNPYVFLHLKDAAYGKQLIIEMTGAHAFSRLVIKNAIPRNSTFSGIYHFADSPGYNHYFPRFLNRIKDGGLIMCHPGLSSPQDDTDTIALARYDEYRYFCSDQFTKDCEQHQVQLTRHCFPTQLFQSAQIAQ